MKERIRSGAVVVAVDGSAHAERAVRWAARQASREHRPLLVVTAGEGHHAAVDSAADLARQLHPELVVERIERRQDPRSALIELSLTAHMLVLGSRGRGVITSILLGSVSAAVSAHAACPVVVCRPTPTDGTSHGVLVGADGTRESVPVIEFAFRQASLHGLPLTVLHCYWDAMAMVDQARHDPDDLRDVEDLRALLAESVAGFREDYPDVPVTLTLEHGLVDAALSSRGRAWDLIVVGRHADSALNRLLAGSVATAVLERAHATVAVVPEADPAL